MKESVRAMLGKIIKGRQQDEGMSEEEIKREKNRKKRKRRKKKGK